MIEQEIVAPPARKDWIDVDTARKESERNLPTKTSPQRGTSPDLNIDEPAGLEEKSKTIDEVI